MTTNTAMKIDTATIRISELETLITEARQAYYNTDDPIVSDAEYDAWLDELEKLSPESEALTRTGFTPATSEWVKVAHTFPLGSLDKFNTPEEMTEWVNAKLGGGKTVVSEKLDGLSIGLQYKDGKLVAAPTRGDGLIGEDILTNVVKMEGVIKRTESKFTGTVRGEIILTKTNHQKWFSEYANPRNAASGLCRRFDGEGSEHLTIMAYDVMSDEELFATEQEKFEWLTKNGFITPNYKVCEKPNDITDLWREYQDKTREALGYEIDGLVVSLDNLSHPLAKESHNLKPRSKKAFKFSNQFVRTTVKKITWEVGGSGRVVPRCWFDAVNVLGSTIEKASVYNVAYIKKLGLGVGAEVDVCKAGDIIPRIERVITPADVVVQEPNTCPSCSAKIIHQGEYLICPNKNCKLQVIGRLAKWVDKLNILELGEGLIEKLVDSGLATNPADLYTLRVEDFAGIERMGDKSAQNVFDSIWKCNPVSLDLFLGGLSIENIGSRTVQLLMASGFNTLEKIRAMDIETIKGVKGMGETRAASLVQGLKDYEEVIDQLIENGVEIMEEEKVEAKSNKLDGLSFVFTGKSSLPRKELQALVIENGGTCPSSVSKTTSHLVVADPDSGSSKIKKAEKLGTKVISEEQFMAMIEG